MADLESNTGREAFREAYAEAERTAATEAGLTDAAPEQARDDAGRFAAVEPSVVAEPVVEPVPPVAETTDERDTRIAALEAQLAEKESFIGRQASEIGDLRSTVDERFAAYDERLNTPARQQITQDYIEQNPSQAAQLAYEQGDTVALGNAYQQWAIEDPAAAATWVGERRLAEAQAQFAAEQKALRAEVEQRFAPIAQQQNQSALAAGVAGLPPEVRAFLSDAPTVEALATEFPSIGTAIVTGTVSERLNAINALHGIHRGRTADTLTTAATDVARSTAQEAQAARDEAYVASATASEAESLTWEQQEQQRMTEIFQARSAPNFGGALVGGFSNPVKK